MRGGRVGVHPRRVETWTQQGPKLTAAPRRKAPAELGTSVALSASGNMALAGAPGDGPAGAAWAFTRSGSSWASSGCEAHAKRRQGTSAGFGSGVALSADGNTALIGGPGWTNERQKCPDGRRLGILRVGRRPGRQQRLEARGQRGRLRESEFGRLASRSSADGDTALIGAPIDNTNAGAAWAFVDAPPPVTTGGRLWSRVHDRERSTGSSAPEASSNAFFEYGGTTAYGSSTDPHQSLGALAHVAPRLCDADGSAHWATHRSTSALVAENSGGRDRRRRPELYHCAFPQRSANTCSPRDPSVATGDRSRRRNRTPSGGLVSARRDCSRDAGQPVGTTFSLQAQPGGQPQPSRSRRPRSGRQASQADASRRAPQQPPSSRLQTHGHPRRRSRSPPTAAATSCILPGQSLSQHKRLHHGHLHRHDHRPASRRSSLRAALAQLHDRQVAAVRPRRPAPGRSARSTSGAMSRIAHCAGSGRGQLDAAEHQRAERIRRVQRAVAAAADVRLAAPVDELVAGRGRQQHLARGRARERRPRRARARRGTSGRQQPAVARSSPPIAASAPSTLQRGAARIARRRRPGAKRSSPCDGAGDHPLARSVVRVALQPHHEIDALDRRARG